MIESRRAREYVPTIKALEKVRQEAEDDNTPAPVRARIAETLETMQMFDNWYQEVRRLPRSVQMTAIRMGARIARLLPGSKADR